MHYKQVKIPFLLKTFRSGSCLKFNRAPATSSQHFKFNTKIAGNQFLLCNTILCWANFCATIPYTGIMKLGPGTSGAWNATIAFQVASWLCSSRPSLLVRGMLYLLVTVPLYSGLVSLCSSWRSLDVCQTQRPTLHRQRICLIPIFMLVVHNTVHR